MSRPVNTIVRFIRRLSAGRESASAADVDLLHGFVTAGDHDAFAALVQRHGPMVWGICRRILQSEDAEDAFQATFCVLARRAGSILQPNLLGNWLYGVAYRTALEAKRKNVRSRAKERPMLSEPAAETAAPGEWSDLRPVLDEEINGLPSKYRVPFVLCYLEEKSNEEAARTMGCPAGTVMSRLAWARERLRRRLSRRGITLSVGLMSAGLSEAALPPLLADAALKAAQGQLVTAKVAALTGKVLTAMTFAKIRNVVLVLALASLIGVATRGLFFQAGAVQPVEPAPQAQAPAVGIAIKGAEFDDFADILNLFKRSGRVTLSKERRAGKLLIEFYKDGIKQPKTLSGAGFDFRGGSARNDPIEFAVQALDMDYLVLGNGKKEHCRVLLKVQVGGSLTSSTEDVPKDFFDFSKARSGSSFTAEASSGKEIPLFWVSYGSNHIASATTIQGVVENNKEGRLAVVSLHLND